MDSLPLGTLSERAVSMIDGGLYGTFGQNDVPGGFITLIGGSELTPKYC